MCPLDFVVIVETLIYQKNLDGHWVILSVFYECLGQPTQSLLKLVTKVFQWKKGLTSMTIIFISPGTGQNGVAYVVPSILCCDERQSTPTGQLRLKWPTIWFALSLPVVNTTPNTIPQDTSSPTLLVFFFIILWKVSINQIWSQRWSTRQSVR